MDFLSAVTLGVTGNADCLVLNSVANVEKAAGDEAHNFIVVVEDNFSNSYELEFDFNNRNVKDDDLTIVPIGNFSPLLK